MPAADYTVTRCQKQPQELNCLSLICMLTGHFNNVPTCGQSSRGLVIS